MTTDDLRTRAREAAARAWPAKNESNSTEWMVGVTLRHGFRAGYLAHAAQQPTREQIARAIYDADGFHAADTWDTDTQMMRDGYLHRADAVLALLNGADR